MARLNIEALRGESHIYRFSERLTTKLNSAYLLQKAQVALDGEESLPYIRRTFLRVPNLFDADSLSLKDFQFKGVTHYLATLYVAQEYLGLEIAAHRKKVKQAGSVKDQLIEEQFSQTIMHLNNRASKVLDTLPDGEAKFPDDPVTIKRLIRSAFLLSDSIMAKKGMFYDDKKKLLDAKIKELADSYNNSRFPNAGTFEDTVTKVEIGGISVNSQRRSVTDTILHWLHVPEVHWPQRRNNRVT